VRNPPAAIYTGGNLVHTGHMTAQQVLEAKSARTAHYMNADGIPECGATGSFLIRRVADASAYVTCSKCRKAHGQVHMTGAGTHSRPVFETGRRVYGR